MNRKMIEIIYEDEEIVVCVKPAGVLSQESEAGGENMISLLKEAGCAQVYPVHRLDRGVSGVMVYAKTAAAAAKLNRQVQERAMGKEYLAVIHGVPREDEGVLEDILFKDSAKNKSYVVKTLRKGAKCASLAYRRLETVEHGGEEISLIRVRLHTGRTHQIRVQFASRKLPLLGDGKYGSKDHYKEIALYSASLDFSHPRTGKALSFSRLPDGEKEPWAWFQLL